MKGLTKRILNTTLLLTCMINTNYAQDKTFSVCGQNQFYKADWKELDRLVEAA